MRHTFPKRFYVPEAGSDRKFKRFLLSYGWRVCTDCGIRRRKRGLVLRIDTQVHWLCVECRKKLIHHRWAEEVDQNLVAMYDVHAEHIMVAALNDLVQEQAIYGGAFQRLQFPGANQAPPAN